MTASHAPAEAAAIDRWRWVGLAIVIVAAFMDLLDVTIVNIAIPAIRADLGTSAAQIQWVAAGYVLAFAVGLITGGRLGDVFGRRRIFLVGVAGFSVASAACGLAVSADMLVAARVVQGAAAAIMVPQVLSIAHANFPAHERGKVFGLWGAIVGMGGLLGPLVGAVLIQWDVFGLGWRPIFLINLPVGIAAMVLGRRYIAESRSPHPLRLDLVGVALGALALLLLLSPLSLGEELGWPAWTFVAMAGSIAVFALLIMSQRRKAAKDGSPLIELDLFRVPSFSAGFGVQIAFGVATGAFFLVWTLYMQVGLGWSVIQAGLTGIPFSIATAVAAGISVEKLVPRFGRKVLQAGALIMAAGMLVFLGTSTLLGQGVTPWQMMPALVVLGAGMGLIVAPLASVALSEVPHHHAGSASGLISTALQVGNACGLGLTSVFFFSVVGDAAGTELPAGIVAGFENSLAWVAGVLVVAFLCMFALPAGRATPAGAPVDAAPVRSGRPVPSKG